jgi:hypothetical protein
VVLFSFICDIIEGCHVFNLLYAAPGDWMRTVLLVQVLRVALIPTVARTAVHFLTMRGRAFTEQHAT